MKIAHFSFNKYDSIYIFWAVIFIWMIAATGFQTWNRGEVIKYDVSSYYSYLPALFIHKDLSFSYLIPEERKEIWFEKTSDGKRVQRMTMGLSFLYLPFFLLAHAFVSLGGFDLNEYSIPYQLALTLSCLFYGSLGLWLLRQMLLNFFKDEVVGFTLLGIGLGSNLLCYTTLYTAMSHAYSFFLLTLLLTYLLKWYHSPTLKYVVYSGLLFGLVVLIRPTNTVVLSLPLFFYTFNYFFEDHRFPVVTKPIYSIFIFTFCVLIIWLPQLFY